MNVSWYSNLSVCPSFSLSICRSVKTLSTFLSIIFVILEFVCITDTFYICMRSFHFCGCMCISMYVDVCVFWILCGSIYMNFYVAKCLYVLFQFNTILLLSVVRISILHLYVIFCRIFLILVLLYLTTASD